MALSVTGSEPQWWSEAKSQSSTCKLLRRRHISVWWPTVSCRRSRWKTHFWRAAWK